MTWTDDDDDEDIYGSQVQTVFNRKQESRVSTQASKVKTPSRVHPTSSRKPPATDDLPYTFRKIGRFKIVENVPGCLEAIKPYCQKVYHRFI